MKDLKTASQSSVNKKVLLIGDSGSGKTSMIGTFPKPIVCDFDGKGEETLAGKEGCIETYAGAEGWDRFKKDLVKWVSEGLPNGCQTLALDSLTFASDTVLQWVRKANNNNGPTLTQADWGRAIDEIKSTLAKLVTANFHVVVTIHLSIEKDDLIGGVVWIPSIYGSKLPAQIPAYFNDVLMTKLTINKGVPEYMVQTIPDSRLKILKNTSRGKWSATEAPNFGAMLAKLGGKEDGSSVVSSS